MGIDIEAVFWNLLYAAIASLSVDFSFLLNHEWAVTFVCKSRPCSRTPQNSSRLSLPGSLHDIPIIAISSESSITSPSTNGISTSLVSVTLIPDDSSVRLRDFVTFVGPKAVRVTSAALPRLMMSAWRVFGPVERILKDIIDDER